MWPAPPGHVSSVHDIRAELEKGNRDRLLPMTPDFAEFLQSIPEVERTGPVFVIYGQRGNQKRMQDWISRIISRIGKAAGVKVNTDKKGKVKSASAHDLRRSFGFRWALRVMPAVLQQLMRHEDISTTMKYYVGQDAERIADAVWAVVESTEKGTVNTFVNSDRILGGEHENADDATAHVQKDLASAPRRTRTFDPLIKSQLLCQLS